MGFGKARRAQSQRDANAIVLLDDVRAQRRTAQYLPLWIGAAGFLATLVVLYSAPDFLNEIPDRVGTLIQQVTTSVDHKLSTPSSLYFSQCHAGGGTNCVVDGDTFWVAGVKVRLSDIDAPETHPPRCSHEAALGDRATSRLQALLNAGPIELRSGSRDEDVYGRKLRVVSRDGHSLGMQLVSEGLAREWDGARHPWCPAED